MYPIQPLGPIASKPLLIQKEAPVADPALNPLKQSLAVISPLTPSLEGTKLYPTQHKLKLAAIEDKTQATTPQKITPWPQLVLDLTAYKDPSQLLPLLKNLAREELCCLKLTSQHLLSLNISFVKDCQSLGFQFFLDLCLKSLDTKQLASLAYISPSFVSYSLESLPTSLVEKLLHAHYAYLPGAQVVLRPEVDPFIQHPDSGLIASVDASICSYQKALKSLPVWGSGEGSTPLLGGFLHPVKNHNQPCILCKAPELSKLRQHLGPNFSLMLLAEDISEARPFDIAQVSGLNLASFIVLGNSILQAQNPKIELEKILSYLRSSFS